MVSRPVLNRARQHGAALITTLILVSIAVAIATAIMFRLEIDIKKTENIVVTDQAYTLAISAENAAIDLLYQHITGKEAATDTLEQSWTQPITFPVDNDIGLIKITITDADRKFNINNLVDEYGEPHPGYIAALKRLFELAELQPNEIELVDTIADWIDTNSERPINSTAGAEDYEYSGKAENPHYTPNHPITSITELKLLVGMTPEIYKAVSPYLVAIPKTLSPPPPPGQQQQQPKQNKNELPEPGTTVNVLTADPIVVAALFDQADLSTITNELQTFRAKKDAKLSDFLAQPNIQNLKPLIKDPLSEKSRFFILDIDTQFATGSAKLRSLVERDDNNHFLVKGRSRGEL